MPQRFRVRYAASVDDVLSELQKFIEYIKSGPIIAMLPSALHGISSQDAGELARWQEQIAIVRRGTCPVGAIVSFWLDLLDEMFTGARRRLNELGARDGCAPPLVGKWTGIAPDDVFAGDHGRSGVPQQRS
jgi:hypothetical protein